MDTGGIDPIELAQAHHIAWVLDGGDAAMGNQTSILRVGEDQEVSAVVGAQSGMKLASVSATVTLAVTKDDNDAIMLEDGMISAIGPGTAEITASSAVAGLSSKLTVTVTKPVTKVVFMVGDDAAESEYFLAAGQSTAEITAVAQNADGETVAVRSNWSWSSDDTGVATVAQTKDADKKLVEMGAKATITGAGEGDASISATVEGVSGSIDVSVTGQTKTAFLRASTSSNGNSFVWDLGADTPAWVPANTAFQVFLYDIVSNERIGGVVSVVSSNSDVVSVDSATVTATAGGTAAPIVTVTPGPSSPVAADAGKNTAIVTLTATGADPIRILFNVEVKAAPASN